MPIINSYPNDINIQDKDAWIGTDSYNRQTKQYTAEAVAKYLNVKGKVSIAGQINYKFVDTPFDGSGTMAFAAGNGFFPCPLIGTDDSRTSMATRIVFISIVLL